MVRPILLSLARRILGSKSEAEDTVQETYLRWQKTELGRVRSPEAFLTTTITRLCLNQLKLRRVRLHQDEPRLVPDELEATTRGPDQHAELADALTEAFARMLANLSPTEIAVFLLREAFDFDYSDIAPIAERSAENCRQILKRARERLMRDRGRYETDSEQNRRIVQTFREAVMTGELKSLLDMLSADAVLLRDGGDLSLPAPPPVSGAALKAELGQAVNRMMAGSSRLLTSLQLPGKHLLVAESDGRVLGALLFQVRQGQIQSINLVTCPALLRPLRVVTRFWRAQTERREEE